MSSWLLSIVGVVVIGALTEVLLSDSNIHKFVRSIYAFFVLLVIAQPLPAFFRDTVSSIQTGGVLELDTALIQTINSQTAAALERNAMEALATAGFDGVIVTINTTANTNFAITAVYINALGIKIHQANQGLNTQQEVTKIVRAITGAPEEAIHYVG